MTLHFKNILLPYVGLFYLLVWFNWPIPSLKIYLHVPDFYFCSYYSLLLSTDGPPWHQARLLGDRDSKASNKIKKKRRYFCAWEVIKLAFLSPLKCLLWNTSVISTFFKKWKSAISGRCRTFNHFETVLVLWLLERDSGNNSASCNQL